MSRVESKATDRCKGSLRTSSICLNEGLSTFGVSSITKRKAKRQECTFFKNIKTIEAVVMSRVESKATGRCKGSSRTSSICLNEGLSTFGVSSITKRKAKRQECTFFKKY